MTTVADRLHSRAETVDLRRVLLTLVAALPFVVGAVAGVVWMSLTYLWAGLIEGFCTVRDRSVP